MFISFEIERQPDDVTCGPTCLHAVYGFHQDRLPLEQLIQEVTMLDEGGTLLANLGIHALKRGYRAEINSFNIRVFDPSWFSLNPVQLQKKLKKQAHVKQHVKIARVSRAYAEFLAMGGGITFSDLTAGYISQLMALGLPIICGLSSTFLYKTVREKPKVNDPRATEYDDIAGEPSGHFVVLAGMKDAKVMVFDPYHPNPISQQEKFIVSVEHLINAILLGVITFDANLLMIKK